MKPMHRRRRLAMLTAFAIAGVLASAACAADDATAPSDATSPSAPDSSQADGIPVSAVVRPDSVYSMDNLVAAGYKKSRQFDTETVPHATDVWYGFFNQRDIEVRVYESHGDALEFGVGPAEEAIGHEAGQRDYLIPVVNLYPAYMVVGNMVMLCERELAVCKGLVDKLP